MSLDKYHISLGHLVNKVSHNVRMLNNNCCCSAGSLCAHFCCFGFACFYKHCVLLCSCYKRRNTDLSLCEGVPLFLHATKVRILPWKSCGLSRFWKQPQVATCGTAVSVTSVQTSFFSLCCFLKLDEMTDDKSKFLMILVKTGAHKAFYSIHLKTLMSLYYAPIQELHNISLTKVRAWW